MAITLTPLIGAQDGSGILSYLLIIDEGRILLDCGCPDRPPQGDIDGYIRTLANLAPTLDLVLLSHPLLSSVGLVPLLRARLGLRCPIYATLPTKEMGRWAAEEWVGQRALEESHGCLAAQTQPPADNPLRQIKEKGLKRAIEELHLEPDPKLEEASDDLSSKIWKLSFKELRDAFDSVVAVRYSQPIYLSGKLRPLTLTAHKSGHTIGGTIWSLRSPLHTVSSASSSTVIYAPIFNHVREHHLDSAALVQSTGEGNMRIGLGMSRPMVMIVGTERSLLKGVKKKDRHRVFLDSITQTLKSSHSVLIPSDPSARLIELLLLLDSHWTQSRLDCFPICLVSQTGKEVVTFIRSLTEWMSPALARSSLGNSKRGGRDQGDPGPFRLRHLRFFNSSEALESDSSNAQPRVIIAIPMSMDYGFSRTLFTRMAANEGNLIVLTSPGLSAIADPPENGLGPLSHQLVAAVAHAKTKNSQVAEKSTLAFEPLQLNTIMKVELRRKVVLEGEELEQYLEQERRANEQKSKAAAMLARSRQLMEDAESDDLGSESGSDMDTNVAARTLMGSSGWDEFVDENEPMEFDIYVKANSVARLGGGRAPRFRMFPFVERRRKVDSYGEVVDVDAWLKRGDAVEGSSNAENGAQKSKKDNLGTQASVDPPSKFVSHTEEIEVKCKILTIDLEGKADGRALKTIIPQINPKTAVLVNGSSASNADFAESVAAVPSFTKQIFRPKVGEMATVGHDTQSFTVRLGDSIMKNLIFSQVEGFELAYVNGHLEVPDETSIPVLERTQVQKKPAKKIKGLSTKSNSVSQKDGMNVLEPLISASPNSTIFIGDLKLASLKAHLVGLDIPAEFAAEGVLVCGPVSMSHYYKLMKPKFIKIKPEEMDSVESTQLVGGRVAVTKTAKGQITIEGSVGITFKIVRDAVYSLHTRIET
ncbi:hypothetical protein O181_027504 [Austropuccinia psidii MF-1]|uniref:Cleavage and polyadenylation specificity factor subunit 2 n=1 Tax=Austropuccinia psidii MF-1 TaxID=1389203 RepID=A0A9Q3CP54_9BASI|nr:hypothetical protein [Austropuccinia psidii MF-1]